MNLIDAFDNMRFWGNKRNSFLQRIRLYGILNRLIDITANIVLPIYFRLTASSTQYSLNCSDKKEGERIIVSLTSYPTRIRSVWKVIECLMRQRVKPDKIVLYLTESQMHSIDSLPKSILKLRKRGLEIRLCPDEIRSHTKYFYAFQEYPKDLVVTVDDDSFYRTDLIDSLLKEHKNHPKTIICNWAREILSNKYEEWPNVNKPRISKHFLLLGVSGVLYPPHCMYKDISNATLIRKLCLTADDVWLSCMALLNQTPILFTGYKFNHFQVLIRNNQTLITINRDKNQVCVDNLNTYYKQKLGISPFADLPID